MIRIKATYRDQKLELGQPLDLPEGAEIEVAINVDDESDGWYEMGIERLKEVWDNPKDAIYDDWKKLYGVQGE